MHLYSEWDTNVPSLDSKLVSKLTSLVRKRFEHFARTRLCLLPIFWWTQSDCEQVLGVGSFFVHTWHPSRADRSACAKPFLCVAYTNFKNTYIFYIICLLKFNVWRKKAIIANSYIWESKTVTLSVIKNVHIGILNTKRGHFSVK